LDGRAELVSQPEQEGVQPNYILEHRDAPQNVVQGWSNGLGVRGSYEF
jgi:hypothetical protein